MEDMHFDKCVMYVKRGVVMHKLITMSVYRKKYEEKYATNLF